MGWIDKLKQRWNLNTTWQVLVVLFVFACTGFTVMFLKNPLLGLIDPSFKESTIFTMLYYILILPVYNLFLLFYGLIFGKFKFFWEFEKRFVKRMTGRK